MLIRQATPDDAEGIARVHVDSWRSTYNGIVSAQLLADLKVENRKKNWEWTFQNLNPDETIFVAVDEQGSIVGFANCGKSRSDEYGCDGELYAIYLLRDCQGKGIGKRLVKEVVQSLRQKQYKAMMLWVLEANPSVAFYRKLGGEPLAKKEIAIGPDTLIEVAYGWKRLDDIRCGEG